MSFTKRMLEEQYDEMESEQLALLRFLCESGATAVDALCQGIAGRSAPDFPGDVRHLTHQRLRHVEGGLVGMARLLHQPLFPPTVDHAARLVLETAARIYWHVGSDSSSTLLVRTLNELLVVDRELDRLHTAMGRDEGRNNKGLAVIERAEQEGFAVIRDRRGRVLGIGATMPTATELVGEVLRHVDQGTARRPVGELTYMRLSAATHASYHGVSVSATHMAVNLLSQTVAYVLAATVRAGSAVKFRARIHCSEWDGFARDMSSVITGPDGQQLSLDS